MLEGLPEFINIIHLAQQATVLKGYVPLTHLSRLHDSLCEVRGSAYIEWTLTLDLHQRALIKGFVQAMLPMLCQRCLQPMEWLMNAPVTLAALHSGQTEEALPPEYDVIPLQDGPVSLVEMIEDELILALPIVAVHEQCPSNEYNIFKDAGDSVVVEERVHPFRILQTLKK